MAINPEAGLVLDYNISPDDLTGSNYPGNFPNRDQDTVLAFETTLPSSFSGSSGFLSIGGSGTGAWAGVYDDGGTYKFALSAGDGEISASPRSSTSNRAVDLEPISNISEFDGGTHTVVLEFRINPGRVRAWIDGTLYLEGSTTGGGALEANTWAGSFNELLGSSVAIAGFPSTEFWDGEIKSGLRVYSDTLVNGQAIYGTGTYGVASYGEVPVNVSPYTYDETITGSVGTVTVSADSNLSVTGVQASGTTDPDIIITADATHTVTSVQGVSATSSVGVVGVAIIGVTGVQSTGVSQRPAISGDANLSLTGVAGSGATTAPTVSADANVSLPSIDKLTLTCGGAEGRPSTVVQSDDYGGGFELTGTVNATFGFIGEANTTPEEAEATGSATAPTISGDANFAIPAGVSATTAVTTAEGKAGAAGQPTGVQAVGTADPDVVIEGDATHTITSVQGVNATGGVGDVVAGANIDSVPSVDATGSVETATVTASASVEPESAEITGTIGDDINAVSKYTLESASVTGTADFGVTSQVTADSNVSVGSVSATIITDQPDVTTDDIETTADAIVDLEDPTLISVSATGAVGSVSISENAIPTFGGAEALASPGNVTVTTTTVIFDVANKNHIRTSFVEPDQPRIVYVQRAA